MKVVAINSSPLMGKGNTALILDPFLEGMREAGAEVELLYTKKLDIKPCQGDFICWTKTPGECHQKDDMEWVRPKMAEADLRLRGPGEFFGTRQSGMPDLKVARLTDVKLIEEAARLWSRVVDEPH